MNLVTEQFIALEDAIDAAFQGRTPMRLKGRLEHFYSTFIEPVRTRGRAMYWTPDQDKAAEAAILTRLSGTPEQQLAVLVFILRRHALQNDPFLSHLLDYAVAAAEKAAGDEK